MDQDTRTLYVAFELGEKEWKLAMAPNLESRPRLRTLRARSTSQLLEVLGRERERLACSRVVSCYEAGRDGFWLDRFLQAHGIESRIVDSASIEVRRRARRVKTDRLDAQKLLTMLHREALGEKDVWSVVHVPSVADEDARSLQREYRTLVKERSRSSNRIKGLLASQGLVAPRIDRGFLDWLASARLWDGSPVPPGMCARVEREYARWRFTHDQVLAIREGATGAHEGRNGPEP
jgi:transposase